MSLKFLGKATDGGHSPTLWEDGDEFVIQGFAVSNPEHIEAIGGVPANELVIRVPKRLMNFLPPGGSDGPTVR
ncbi:hypothetical protein AB0I81_34710 [Nonomuraea sp. NPDC050404]|uniref:hypothetical protein n=1 Tax=Nonomuraea sp. NPDC050404 TaxID=3155783 RepID=UPI0033C1279F